MKMIRRAIPRLSRVWVPSGGRAATESEDAHSKLIRAGFLRPSQPGIFHMLPLGRRVQEKIERLIVRHMEDSLGASRVSLSTISTEELWTKSGRLSGNNSELFRFSDRKNTRFLLSPTHEEEITALVSRTVQSYKDLPLRLYQITRKYRDEFRPRHGLLRGREFTMKDLYTFDMSVRSALETYEKVRVAYRNIFAEMKLPVLVAKASSGDMGGDLSHEYHLPTSLGEDHVVSCDSCEYVINDEMAETTVLDKALSETKTRVWRGINKDRSMLVNVWYPKSTMSSSDSQARTYTNEDVNVYAIKAILPDLDAGIEDPLPFWIAAMSGPEPTAKKLINIMDSRCPASFRDFLDGGKSDHVIWPRGLDGAAVPAETYVGSGNVQPNMIRIRPGDHCPKCNNGKLSVQKAIELGHTFHLGTRYSVPLEAKISVPSNIVLDPVSAATDAAGTSKSDAPRTVNMQMGCYGIGISRIIGAVADHLADGKGLNWPAAIAPYSCVVVPAREEDLENAVAVYRQLLSSRNAGDDEHLDVIVDDRKESLPRRLTDADLIGIPIIVVLGREWRASQRLEVQCRRLNVKTLVQLDALAQTVKELLEKL